MNPLLKKAYWALASMGALYFVSLGCLMNPWVQRKYIHTTLLELSGAPLILLSIQHVIYE